jgi:hypothetical protein
MDKDKHWRLSAVTAIVTMNTNEVSLLNQEDTKLINRVLRESEKSGRINKKYNILDEFEVKIDEITSTSCIAWENILGFSIFIKSDELPNPKTWYHLLNLSPEFLKDLILSCEFDKASGIFSKKFSAAVTQSADLIDKVGLVTEEIKEYPELLEESMRYLNCKTNKKAKKWIPGHRYDSPIQTIYLLCKTKIRKNMENGYLDEPEQDAWIYTNAIDPRMSKVSDVLMTKTFGSEPEDLKYLTKLPTEFVESGEVLENDYTEINDYLEHILEESINRYYSSGSEGFSRRNYVFGENIEYLFYPYLLINKNMKSEYLVGALKAVIKKFGYYILYLEYDVNVGFVANKNTLSSKNSFSENVESLVKRIFTTIPSTDINKITFYDSLLKAFGLDIRSIAEDILDDWDPMKFTSSMENFLSNYKYFCRRKSLEYADLRHKSNYLNKSRNTLEEIIVSSPNLVQELKNILLLANSGDLSYCSSSTWSGSNKTSYTVTNITLENILQKYNNDISKMPQDLKDEILRQQFINIEIKYDVDADIMKL